MLNIRHGAGKQIVDANHPVAFFNKAVAQVRAKKAGSAGD